MNHALPPTLFRVLTQRWPKIKPDGRISVYLASQACKPVGHISEWSEFTLINVQDTFGDILSQPYTGPLIPLDPTPAVNIKGLDAIKHLESNTLSNLLRPALEQGRAALARRRLPNPNKHEIIEFRRNRRVGGMMPNTSFVRGSDTLVMGTAKRMGDWDASDWKNNLAHPASQLAGYARAGRTRYTYVMTETELVLCQVYRMCGAPEAYGIRRRVVPLDASGVGVLTPGLALWTMVLMALNDSHRHIGYASQTLHFGA